MRGVLNGTYNDVRGQNLGDENHRKKSLFDVYLP